MQQQHPGYIDTLRHKKCMSWTWFAAVPEVSIMLVTLRLLSLGDPQHSALTITVQSAGYQPFQRCNNPTSNLRTLVLVPYKSCSPNAVGLRVADSGVGSKLGLVWRVSPLPFPSFSPSLPSLPSYASTPFPPPSLSLRSRSPLF